MTWPPKWLKKLRVTRVALVGQGANPDADMLIYKAKTVEPATPDDDEDDTTKSMPARGDVHVPGASRKQTTYKTEGTMPEPTEVEKQNADLAARIAKAEAEHTALIARVAKAEQDREAATAQIAKLESDRRAEQYIAKARTLSGLPGVDDSFGPLLEKAEANMTPEQVEKFETVLRSARTAVQKGGLFTELGRNGGADTRSDKTTAAILKAAGGIKKYGKISNVEEVEKSLRAAEADYNEEWANAPSADGTGHNVGSGYLQGRK